MGKLSTLLAVAVVLIFLGCKREEQAPIAPSAVSPLTAENKTNLLRDIVKGDPKNLDAWIKLGNAYMDSNKFADAVEAYGKALELDPKNVDVRVDMGTCLRNMGRPDRAVEEYRKAIAMSPQHLNARRNLGVVLAFDLGDKAGAIKEFETYLSLSPAASDRENIRKTIEELKAGK